MIGEFTSHTIGRLHALQRKVGGNTTYPFTDKTFHEVLDGIDRQVGIRTRHGCAAAYHAGAVPFPQSEYVGARLARLERHVSANKEPAMFWLGAEGESGQV